VKRLVYSPSVKAWVKTDTGIIDLSPYITDCKIERKINEASNLEIVFRNPKVMQGGKPRFLFTQRIQNDGSIGPVFHPMDPITVVLERIAGRPIQAFTGYCDTVPYVQMFPGAARITASCTLKRLLYTYWDPALPFVYDFMKEHGWILGGDGMSRRGNSGNVNQNNKEVAPESVKLNDSSIGYLLYAVLNEVGGWDPKNIYVQPLPDNIGQTVANLFKQFSEDNKNINREIADFVRDIIGAGPLGSGVVATSNSGSGAEGSDGQPLGGGQDLSTPPANFYPDLRLGIRQVAYAVLKQFPALSITSTNGGTHASGSYHYQNRAVDIGGDTATMNRAANWIHSNVGKNLVEGIHNPNLSIKNQEDVDSSFWDSGTWAGHANHIHLAV
jgi:hypothetical protein